MIELVPVTLRDANQFVEKYHRHHKAWNRRVEDVPTL